MWLPGIRRGKDAPQCLHLALGSRSGKDVLALNNCRIDLIQEVANSRFTGHHCNDAFAGAEFGVLNRRKVHRIGHRQTFVTEKGS